MEEEKRFYKIVMYANNSLYKLNGFTQRVKLTDSFFAKHYFNILKSKNPFKKSYKDLVVCEDLWNQLYKYHLGKGNKDYCEAIDEVKDKMDITMIYSQNCDPAFPWFYDSILLNFFGENIPAEPNILFVGSECYNDDVTCTEEEYNLFYNNICTLCDTMIKGYTNYLNNMKPKVMDHNEANSEPTVYYPNEVKLIYNEDNVLDIVNLDEIKDYMNNTYFNGLSERGNFTTGKTSDGQEYTIITKPGVFYIGDNNNGILEGYIGYNMNSKYKN